MELSNLMSIKNVKLPRQREEARDLISVFWNTTDRLQTKLVSDHLLAAHPPADWISDVAEDHVGS